MNPVSGLIDDESEVELSDREHAALLSGLAVADTAMTSPVFNSQLLERATDGDDFDPWPKQIVTRLTWMLPPAIIAFGLCMVALQWLATRLQPLDSPPNRTARIGIER